jgi:S-(hydroxymethyl)glutathione dehydrogenase/alcohol dehydrogenase
MKAAVLHAFDGTFDVEDVELAAPIRHEVVVDVKASGLCHSDLHMAQNNFGAPLPQVLGHEVAGIVAEVGPDVTEFAVGDRVVGSLIQVCGHCAACRAGRPYQCRHPEETLRGPGEPPRITAGGQPVVQMFGMGGFAERALIHENQLAKLPDDVPWPQAAILGCGVITGAGAAINTAGVKPGDTVAVVGLGGVGLNVINGARLAGAERIIGVDRQTAKFPLATKFGATDTVDSGACDAAAAIREMTDGGVDVAFEVIGLAETTKIAVQATRTGGGIYLIGIWKPGTKLELDPLGDLLMQQKRVQGVMMGSTDIRHDIPMYARLYLAGRFDLDDLISREISLAGINDAYAELEKGEIARSVITSF